MHRVTSQTNTTSGSGDFQSFSLFQILKFPESGISASLVRDKSNH